MVSYLSGTPQEELSGGGVANTFAALPARFSRRQEAWMLGRLSVYPDVACRKALDRISHHLSTTPETDQPIGRRGTQKIRYRNVLSMVHGMSHDPVCAFRQQPVGAIVVELSMRLRREK